MVELTEVERKLLIYFLADYDQVLSRRGCNDLTLNNTEEIRNLVIEANRISNFDVDPPEEGLEQIHTQDNVILLYLATKIRGEDE